MKRYRVKVKVCGLTTAADARMAADEGADFLGFIFAPSPRGITVDAAGAFWPKLPCGVPRVGVFRDQPSKAVTLAVNRLAPDYLQFHGSESPAFCRSFGVPVIRALSAREVSDLRVFELYREAACFLVDLPKEEPAEEALPFEIARAAMDLGKPVMLAGGLDPGNVGRYVGELRPFGVDVARGVEASPGRKDFAKMREFIRRARGA